MPYDGGKVILIGDAAHAMPPQAYDPLIVIIPADYSVELERVQLYWTLIDSLK